MKEGWKYVRLGDVFPFVKNGANIKQTKGASGIPITRIETLANGIFNRDRLGYANITDASKYESYILKSGDILMSHINSVEHVGRTVVCRNIDCQIIHGMNLLRLIPIKNADSSFYVYYFKTESFRRKIKEITHKSVNQASFNTTNLKEIQIPLPPLPEQQRIVTFLDTEFAKIDALKAKAEQSLQNAKDLFQAALKEEMTPKERWEEKTLKEISLIAGNYGLSVSSCPFNEVRYLRITDISDWGELNEDKVSANIDSTENQSELIEGDILFARTGATVGKTLVYNSKMGKCVFAGYLIRYRIDSSIVLPQYLFYETHSPWYYEWVRANQQAAAQPNISAKIYNSYKISFPPVTVQRAIVSRLDTLRSLVTELEQKYTKIAAECDALKQALLRETFE